MSEEFKCEWLIDDGICNGGLDVLCEYQSVWTHENKRDLRSIRERYCKYPNRICSEEVAKAIECLAEYGLKVNE